MPAPAQSPLLAPYTILWVLWLAQFFAIEGQALYDMHKKMKAGGTLTEHVRWWFSVGFQQPGWRARRITLMAFLCWLFFHMLFPGMV